MKMDMETETETVMKKLTEMKIYMEMEMMTTM